MTTPQNIPQISIKDLIKQTVIRSSLLAVIDFRDLILVSPNFKYTEIMEQIVRDALQLHERKCPLFKRSKIYMSCSEYTFVDNFKGFLDGTITEEYLTLVPKVVYNMDTSLLHMRRSWNYVKPTLHMGYALGKTWVDYMCSYPVVFKSMLDDANCPADEFTDDSKIYYIDPHDGKTQDYMFRKAFYLTLLKYINNIKNNLQYPDLPISLLNGIEVEIQTVETDLMDFYRKCYSHGKALR